MKTYSRREFLALFFPSGRMWRRLVSVARLTTYLAIIGVCLWFAFSIPAAGWRMVLTFVVPGILVLWIASAGYDMLKVRGFTTTLRVIHVAGELISIVAWMAAGAMVHARWAQDGYISLISVGVLLLPWIAGKLQREETRCAPGGSSNSGSRPLSA